MVRVPYVTREDLPEEDHQLLRSFRSDTPEELQHLLSTDERNVYRTLAHAPRSLAAFREFGGTLREELDLDPRERELIILTAASELRSAYEWHQHVRIGLAEGLSRDEIMAISTAQFDGFDEEERALMAYVADYVTGSVDDDVYEAFARTASDSKVVSVGLLVGMYIVIARQMETLGVETEEPFVGWDLENL